MKTQKLVTWKQIECFHLRLCLLFLFFLLLPLQAKKVPYNGERQHGFRCYSCVTRSPDWATERCSPRFSKDMYAGCGNGTTGCFKWIVNHEMTIRGCGINFLSTEEEDKTFDFNYDQFPRLSDMCRNLTDQADDARNAKKKKGNLRQSIRTILAHSYVNKLEHEKYLQIFNVTCQRILRISHELESRPMARHRSLRTQRHLNFCKWYDGCNEANERAKADAKTFAHALLGYFIYEHLFRREF